MIKKLLRLVTAFVGAGIGYGILALLDSTAVAFNARGIGILDLFEEWAIPWIYASVGLLFAIIFFIFSPKIIDGISSWLKKAEETLTKMPVADIFFAALGLILGLLIALLLTTFMRNIPIPWVISALINVGLYLLCGYLGVSAVIKRRMKIPVPRWLNEGNAAEGDSLARPKVLDTSVIIDGRIFDICQTGVMEGVLVVPGFVLQELRHIADSADAMKRGRGRRGLDILSRMQKELPQSVRVEERDYEEVAEVDLKLLKLAQEIEGVVVTNDYNLNKVASVQDVPVFNINELANAIKPVVLPGEEMQLSIVKEGKESGQGVGYLDDGTMIVVEGGKRCIGEDVETVVTSVLQTAAGRMIFAKLKA